MLVTSRSAQRWPCHRASYPRVTVRRLGHLSQEDRRCVHEQTCLAESRASCVCMGVKEVVFMGFAHATLRASRSLLPAEEHVGPSVPY